MIINLSIFSLLIFLAGCSGKKTVVRQDAFDKGKIEVSTVGKPEPHKSDIIPPPAYTAIGVAYQNKALYDESSAYSKKAIEINPRYSKAYYNLGLALLYKGLYEDANFYTKKAIEIAPRYSDSYANLCLLYYNQQFYAQAIPQCRKAIELNPENPPAHTTLGSAFYMIGNLKTAREEWKKACELGNQMGCDNLRKFGQ